MGLDWVVLGRPLPGREEEYRSLFHVVMASELPDENASRGVSRWRPFRRRPAVETPEQLIQRYREFPVTSPYETLQAPRVGRDEPADLWAKERYFRDQLGDKLLAMPLPDALEYMKGYYVVELVPPNYGIPQYQTVVRDKIDFRAKFLHLCPDIIGDGVLESAYRSKLAEDAVIFGHSLMALAVDYAKRNSVEHVFVDRGTDADEDSPEFQAHVVFAAAQWCLFWGERGHGFLADF
jgi:hypothetical protein